ncbi:MAG: hypothetical protein UH239_03070 [Acutalibacteraceae bacterium]|nr:hypothetical protein [Acutalibacteraceae bacterium]
MVFSKKISAIALVTTMAVGVMITPMSASAESLTLMNTQNNTNAGEEIDLSQYTSTTGTISSKNLTINNSLPTLVPVNGVNLNTTITTSTSTNNNGRTTLMDSSLNPLLLLGTQTKTSTK